MKNPEPIKVRITNTTRLPVDGGETRELWPGDVLTVTAAEAYDLIGNGKAEKAKDGEPEGDVARVFPGEKQPKPAKGE